VLKIYGYFVFGFDASGKTFFPASSDFAAANGRIRTARPSRAATAPAR